MRFSHQLSSAFVAFSSLLAVSHAQAINPVEYTDPETGIVFNTWSASNTQTQGGLTMGFAMPSDARTTDASEYIGLLTCSSPNGEGTGWCGISLGGPMPSNLLLMAWPNGDEILTQLQWASGYDLPIPYAGDAKVTQISSRINATNFELIYRCEGCLQWDHGGETGGISTSSGFMLLGWAHAHDSPGNPTCPADVLPEQHDTQHLFPALAEDSIANAAYDSWAALATKTVTGDCDDGPSPTGTDVPEPTAPVTGIPVPTQTAYDYVIVGAGAGGIPLADKLSESGKSVLLIEKGGPSTGRFGGDRKPEWLEGTDLTRFDVPGLCNEIWMDSAGIACTDMDQMAGCILGGGTAVNAGMWWKPNPLDWDFNFPAGWKASDMVSATNRVFSRIPGTTTTSMDGERYYQQGADVVMSGLRSAGWSEVSANDVPDRKNRTFTYSPFMFADGERGGPMATYLVTASNRNNFDMWLGTAVKRLNRVSGHVTGIEVEALREGGYVGTVPLKPVTGRVILSAGTFGSAKILLRSGIGPIDQLEVVKASATDGATMISEDEWLELPVGYNLEDHTNTDTVITHPDIVHYDFYEAYDTPIEADAQAYLTSRAGILAQAAPNISPVFFDEIQGNDGVVRQLQWTARVEGSLGTPDGKAVTMSQYLGRGAKSRGRMTITPNLNTVVSTVPYLQDKHDIEAVIKGIENMQEALSGVPGLEFQQPPPGVSARKYVEDMVVSTANRRANHWIGTCKIGPDDGRSNGSAVVDTNTRVWGTDNVFVVDGSIFPGMVSANPSSYIVVAAEHAAQKILALPTARLQRRYEQCGGRTWTGSYQCEEGTTCQASNEYYSQCV